MVFSIISFGNPLINILSLLKNLLNIPKYPLLPLNLPLFPLGFLTANCARSNLLLKFGCLGLGLFPLLITRPLLLGLDILEPWEPLCAPIMGRDCSSVGGLETGLLFLGDVERPYWAPRSANIRAPLVPRPGLWVVDSGVDFSIFLFIFLFFSIFKFD